MCDVVHKYGALTFVDEVLFGNIGEYIAASDSLVDVGRSYGSGFIFTTFLPPTVLSGAIASIRVLRSDEGRQLRAVHRHNVDYLRSKLQAHPLPY